MIGRITKLISGLYTVYSEETNKYYDLKPLGIFRHKEIQPKVGDIVEFNETSILKIKPRFNDLIRPVICNIDQALVVTSLKEPELNLNLLTINWNKAAIAACFHRRLEVKVYSKRLLSDKMSDRL